MGDVPYICVGSVRAVRPYAAALCMRNGGGMAAAMPGISSTRAVKSDRDELEGEEEVCDFYVHFPLVTKSNEPECVLFGGLCKIE